MVRQKSRYLLCQISLPSSQVPPSSSEIAFSPTAQSIAASLELSTKSERASASTNKSKKNPPCSANPNSANYNDLAGLTYNSLQTLLSSHLLTLYGSTSLTLTYTLKPLTLPFLLLKTSPQSYLHLRSALVSLPGFRITVKSNNSCVRTLKVGISKVIGKWGRLEGNEEGEKVVRALIINL